MVALKKCLDNVPKQLWTIDQNKYAQRADYVAREIRVKAINSLSAMRDTEKDPARLKSLNRIYDICRSNQAYYR